MQSKRSERVGDLILEFVSQVLSRGINDPRVGVVTLTGVEVSNDLKHARIFFNLLVNLQEKDEVLSGLKSASGFIRSKIARELKLRFVPTLEFVYDDTQANAQRIEELLRKVKDVE
jgi:ribosome-binding factor A